MPTHLFPAAQIAELVAAVDALAVALGHTPSTAAVDGGVEWVTSAEGRAYEVGVAPDADGLVELDRVAVRPDLRRKRFGSRIYFAVEDWARHAGYRGFLANAQGAGACFAARIGFDFRDDRERRSFFRELERYAGKRLPSMMYPHEVLALTAPLVDGYQALRSISFQAKREFNGNPGLEAVSRAYRAALPHP